MYTGGAGDFACGKFSFSIADAAPSKPEKSTFCYGGYSNKISQNQAPGDFECLFDVFKAGTDVCAGELLTKSGSVPSKDWGGCGVSLGVAPTSYFPNLYEDPIGLGYPDSYALQLGDDCGFAALKLLQQGKHDPPAKGTHYADIVDKAHGNTKIGECVYDVQKYGSCAGKPDAHDWRSIYLLTCNIG